MTQLYQIKLTGDSESVWRDATESAYHHTIEKNRRAVYVYPDPLLAECVEALEKFVSQWNACGPNNDFGRYFANVRTAAVDILAKVQATKEKGNE